MSTVTNAKPPKKAFRKIQMDIPMDEYKTYIEEFERINKEWQGFGNEPLFKGKYFAGKFRSGVEAKEKITALKKQLEELKAKEKVEIVEKEVEVEVVKTKNSPWLIFGLVAAITALIVLIVAFFKMMKSR